MDPAIRRFVKDRAGDRCEYRGVAQEELPIATFPVDHIVARQHGGSDDPENLALACRDCNLHKGPNLPGIDPETGRIATLFHPRLDLWAEHFIRQGPVIVGLTPRGRATVRVLAMNDPIRLEERSE